jgi:hypothetical protein
MQCWVQPKEDEANWDRVIQSIRKEIKVCVFKQLMTPMFSQNFIVDLDLRSSGIQLDKRSFLSCEITLYINDQLDIRSEDFQSTMNGIATNVLQNCPTLFEHFHIFERKR